MNHRAQRARDGDVRHGGTRFASEAGEVGNMSSNCEFTTTAHLVWDAGHVGTATTPAGSTLRVGEAGAWTPDTLLALAAAGALMQHVLQMAAADRVEVLGYVSTVRSSASSPATLPAIHLCPCIVVADEAQEAPVRRFVREAAARSPLIALLGSRATVEPVVQPLWTSCA
jgi:uncharacterized OsmC-like protein